MTLPAPIVVADVDLRDFPFMPLDVARLRDSELASNETPEACWAAVLLWAASWHQVPAASVPNDDKWLAKQAGYVSRGKVAREWADVRTGALRGFIECSDSRLYHPVVAEKALDAWKAKLRQRLQTECARIKKHNQRHGTSIPYPEFEAWFASGCPCGHPLPVPEDNGNLSQGQTRNVPRETQSKGQGEGQGEGQGQGQGQGQGIKEKETTAPSGLVDQAGNGPDDPQPQLPGTEPKAKPYAVPDCPYGALLEAYHAELAMLPTVAVLNDARKEHMRARWREVCAQERFDAEAGLDWFRWYFAHAAKSRFLTGQGKPDRNTGRTWHATFDWLLLPTNFAKVIDGNYLDERAAA